MSNKDFLIIAGEFNQTGQLETKNRKIFDEIKDVFKRKKAKDYVDHLFDMISESVNEVFKVQGVKGWKKWITHGQIATVGIAYSYLDYLKDEREISGNQGWKAEQIAAAQTIASWLTSGIAGGVTGTALGLLGAAPAACFAGVIVVGSVAITIFEEAKFFGEHEDNKSAKEVIADLLRDKVVPKVIEVHRPQNSSIIELDNMGINDHNISSINSINVTRDTELALDTSFFDKQEDRCKNEVKIIELLKSELSKYVGLDKLLNDPLTIILNKQPEEEYFISEANRMLESELESAIKTGCIYTVKLLLTKYKVAINNSEDRFYNSLAVAVEQKDYKIEIIKLLLENGANVNAIKYEPIISRAVRYERIEIIRVLLGDKNIFLNLKKEDNPLYIAVSMGSYDIINLLLEAGADPNIQLNLKPDREIDFFRKKVSCFDTVLDKAIDAGDYRIVELLLKYRANPNIPSAGSSDWGKYCFEEYNLYPLQRAIKNNNITLTKTLLAYKADPNISSAYPQYKEDSFNLLYEAIYSKNIELVRLLLEHGGDPNGNSRHPNPIRYAFKNNIEIAKLIISYSSKFQKERNLALTKKNLLNAIAHAIDYNSINIIKLIFSSYYNIYLDNEVGSCLLVEAAWNKSNLEIINCLIDNKVNINIGCNYDILWRRDLLNPENIVKIIDAENNRNNNEKRFALQEAVKQDNIEIVELLILKGAKVNIIDYFGDTPLSIAVKNSFYNTAELLLKNDADPNYIIINPQDGRTPSGEIRKCFRKDDQYGLLQIAVYNDNYEMAKLLLSYGADVNQKSAYGWLPIIESIFRTWCDQQRKPNYNIAKLLIQYRADPNSEYYGVTLPQLILQGIKEVKDAFAFWEPIFKTGEIPAIYAEYFNKNPIDKVIVEYNAFIEENLSLIKLLINKGFDVNKHGKYNGLTNTYGNSALQLAIKHKDHKMVEFFLEVGADPNSPDAPRYSILYSAIKSLDKDIITKLISYGAYPNIKDLPHIGSYDLKEIPIADIVSFLEVLFQFGGNPNHIIEEMEFRVRCYKGDDPCFSYREKLKDSIISLTTLYGYIDEENIFLNKARKIDLIVPPATNGNDVISLVKPGYYWGLGGNDIFKIHYTYNNILAAFEQLESKKTPIEELRKHHLIIMDFSRCNPAEKIDLSEFKLIKSYSEVNLVNTTILDRPSVLLSINLNGENTEIAALCGISIDHISEANFIFG
ncbi:ankyrin repeat domain-containing protein [Candidatus Jidaibacter acanthamoebae]|nr:ankyrin repeat domain-containing protein [Candidatus Jidaibacter acanthamoeba]